MLESAQFNRKAGGGNDAAYDVFLSVQPYKAARLFRTFRLPMSPDTCMKDTPGSVISGFLFVAGIKDINYKKEGKPHVKDL